MLWDANGYQAPAPAGNNGYPCPSAPFGSLVGALGASGPIVGNTPQPGSFLVGDAQYNYPPSGAGQLSMCYNDWGFGGCTGSQMVRVIVVR